MSAVTDKQVLEALKAVVDPRAGRDIVSVRLVRDVSVCGDAVKVRLLPGADASLRAAAEKAVRAMPGVREAVVEAASAPAPAPSAAAPAAPPEIRSIVAVASGKGGVGKSTVSVNLAAALARAGKRVGVMDVDVYGPSVPGLLGIPREADGTYAMRTENGKMAPREGHGVRVMSLGFFAREDEPVIVRGPILDRAVQQFLTDVAWGPLDVLICDLPPGTGDVPLSLVQRVPLTGVVIVATPQDVALAIASKALRMFEKLRVDVLGLVENMSWFACPHCGGRTEIFSHGGARKACDRYGVPFLGEIPLDLEVRTASDAGRPVVVDRPDGPQAKAFGAVADAVAAQVESALARRAAAPAVAPVSFVKTGPMDV